MKKIIPTILSLIFLSQANATPLKYSLIINADKHHSDFHLFAIDKTSDLPVIRELWAAQTLESITQYTSHPDLAGITLHLLLDETKGLLLQRHINPDTVAMSLYGTDGVRSLDEDTRDELYVGINQYIQQFFNFKFKQLTNLLPTQQGLDDWLAVNYLEDVFNHHSTPTDGLIEVGSDFLEIAFETKDISRPKFITQINFNHKNYQIYNIALTGADMTLKYIHKFAKVNACYPEGFNDKNIRGKFNFATCHKLYSKAFADFHVADYLIPFDSSRIAVIGKANKVFNFFGVEDNSQEALEARLKNICNDSWENIKKEYADAGFSETTLSRFCAHGVFLDVLLYDVLHLQGKQLWVTNKTSLGQKINWPLGEALQ